MSNYAKINSENIVENVIICEDSNISLFSGNYIKETEETQKASIGDTWDTENKKFIAPKPYDSWTLNENFIWTAPVEQLVSNSYWDEDSNSWIVREIITE
jgi:hypothetical protein